MNGRAAFLILALITATIAALTPGLGRAAPATGGGTTISHGLSIYGDLKYPPGFAHFDYVNPDAPKGGHVRFSAIGTFASLNPFIITGGPAADVAVTFQTLMAHAEDEAASAYGLIAESAELPPDRSWVIFNLRPEARFHDGSPITADDVIFSLEILRTKGLPFFRTYYASVKSVEKLGERRVKFTVVAGNNRELPYIIADGLPILSKKFFDSSPTPFDKTTLTPIMGSGPYRIESLEPGRAITYRRVLDYWAANLPTERGRHNFDTIRYDYYRYATVDLEAFHRGEPRPIAA